MNYMRRLIERYPRAAPWIDAVVTSALYALLASLFLEGTLASHSLEIVAIGAGAFIATVLARRRMTGRGD